MNLLIKKFVILLLFFSNCSLLYASSDNVQTFEVEADLGLTYPLDMYHNGSNRIGPILGIEARYNLPSTKWSFGIKFNAATAVRSFGEQKDDYLYEQSNRSINFLAITEYNFNPGRKFNPFINMGIGISSYEVIDDIVYDSSGRSFAFSPKVGIELICHIRIGISAMINRKGYNNCALSLGFVIGGRPKK